MKKFKNLISKLQDKCGYISLETVIIAGLILSLGTFALTQLYLSSREMVSMGADRVYMASDVTVKQVPIP